MKPLPFDQRHYDNVLLGQSYRSARREVRSKYSATVDYNKVIRKNKIEYHRN
jgi:hypothetical protein